MVNRTWIYLLLILFGLFPSCAPVISPELQERVDSSITFEEVAQNPNTYEGRTVLWGGEIIQVLPQENGTDLIEVLQWPLSWREKPRRTVSFQGRFLVLLEEPLDLSLYRRGVKITVAGEIEGSMSGGKIKSVSDPTYQYPLILSKETHVWKDYFYPYSSPEPYVGPWWGNPSYRGLRF